MIGVSDGKKGGCGRKLVVIWDVGIMTRQISVFVRKNEIFENYIFWTADFSFHKEEQSAARPEYDFRDSRVQGRISSIQA